MENTEMTKVDEFYWNVMELAITYSEEISYYEMLGAIEIVREDIVDSLRKNVPTEELAQ